VALTATIGCYLTRGIRVLLANTIFLGASRNGAIPRVNPEHVKRLVVHR
jgi:hypothetical protein